MADTPRTRSTAPFKYESIDRNSFNETLCSYFNSGTNHPIKLADAHAREQIELATATMRAEVEQLRRALEIVAVGDGGSEHAISVLVDIGHWDNIPTTPRGTEQRAAPTNKPKE